VKDLLPFYSLSDLCRALQLSRSTYYAWLKRQPSARQRANDQLRFTLKSLFSEFKSSYGSPRLTRVLRSRGHPCSRKRVEKLMRQQGLVARRRRRFRIRTTNSNHPHPISPNRLHAHGPPTRVDQIWVSDITYIATRQGWFYLAAVMDLYSRKIVGWAMQENLQTSLALNALTMAIKHRQPLPSKSLLHHSDRGSQYASLEYRTQLQQAHIHSSMSRKANCYDNATIESFWSTLKNELLADVVFENPEHARQVLFQSIEITYNRNRLHSSLGYKSPVDFENQTN
jgi:transposase InsO family protein